MGQAIEIVIGLQRVVVNMIAHEGWDPASNDTMMKLASFEQGNMYIIAEWLHSGNLFTK